MAHRGAAIRALLGAQRTSAEDRPQPPPTRMIYVYHRLAFHVAMAKTKFRRISDDPHSHDHRTPSGRRLGQTVGSLDQHRLGRGGGGALAAPLVLDRALAQHGP